MTPAMMMRRSLSQALSQSQARAESKSEAHASAEAWAEAQAQAWAWAQTCVQCSAPGAYELSTAIRACGANGLLQTFFTVPQSQWIPALTNFEDK